jgi:hypothetical protein
MFEIQQSNNMADYNLEQGKDILQYNDDIDKIESPNLNLIQSNTLKEGLAGSNLSYVDKKSLEGLQNIENKFNQTLALYTQTYQQLNEDLLTKRQSKKQIIDYLGKVISNEDGNNYYVNNFGFTHKYSDIAWDKNNSSCPTTSIQYDKKMTNFKPALPMVQGQPCKIAGKNIKNKDTKEEAWVDIKGVKHPYSNKEKNKSCSSQSIELNALDYNLIPTGGAMTKSDECLSLDVNPNLWARLQKLNKKLKIQAIELSEEIEKLSLEDTEIKRQLINKRQQLLQYIDNMNNDNNDIEYNNRILMNVIGEEEDSTLRMNSNYYSYIIWIFVVLFIISLTIATASNDGEKVTGITYIIIAFFVLTFLIYLYRKIGNISINY